MTKPALSAPNNSNNNNLSGYLFKFVVVWVVLGLRAKRKINEKRRNNM